MQASQVDLTGALKSEASGVVGGHEPIAISLGFRALKVSLSFVLLAGTALLLQSLQRIQKPRPGFST